MQSPAFSALAAPMEKVRRVIWLAFNAATLLYVAMAWAMFGAGRPIGAIVPDHPLAVPLIVLALLTTLFARRIGALAMPERRLREIVARDPDPQALARNPQTHQIDQVRLQKIVSLAPHEQRLLAAVSALFVPFIVQMACNESIALYGLVLSFVTRSFPPVLPFAALALALNLNVSPKLEPSLERLRNLTFQSAPAGRV
jgi:hypothetical protein